MGTTGEITIDVGEPSPAASVPLYAASIRGDRATLFVLDGDVVHSRTVKVKGEIGGNLYVEQELQPGTRVVTEGRSLLSDGDKVSASEAGGAHP